MDAVTRVFEHGLSSGSALLLDDHGSAQPVPVQDWLADADHDDYQLVSHCHGPTLDVGCGPGRLTAAVTAAGRPCLGIDISGLAVAMTRARGGNALQRNVFGAVPGESRWKHVLLADGNIGIGGDPAALLVRCGRLLAPGGSVLMDLAPPGTGLVTERLRLAAGELVSHTFAWSMVGVDALAAVAHRSGFAVARSWRAGHRHQAELLKAAP